jgi:hypothetical protein
MVLLKDTCPYLEITSSGQAKCGTDDVMEMYLPRMHPEISISDFCYAENWIECIYFRRAKLL